MADSDRLVWMDLEMTGLDPTEHRIIEIATLVTDAELDVVAEGPDLVIRQPDAVLAAMNPWSLEHHAASGLLDRVRQSTVGEEEAAARTLEFLQTHCHPGSTPLAGNSVHVDRSFLRAHLPQVEAHLHYRNVDVTAVKELARRWFPQIFSRLPKKRDSHRALDDIHESIAELRYYRRHVFREQDTDH